MFVVNSFVQMYHRIKIVADQGKTSVLAQKYEICIMALEHKLTISQIYLYPTLAPLYLRHIHTDTVVISVI